MDLQAYDRLFAPPLQRAFALTFSRARHALTAALGVLGVRSGQAVLLSPLNCRSVPLALLAKGWKPRYADVDRATLNLAPDAVRGALASGEIKACVFQLTYGHDGGEAEVAALCAELGVPLVIDAAHAFPLAWEGRSPGRVGKVAIFSLDFGKPLPTGGGGLLVLDDMGIAMRIKNLRDRLPATRTSLGQRLAAHVHRRWLTPRSYWRLFDLARRTSSSYGPLELDAALEREIRATEGRPSARQARWGTAGLASLEERARHALACVADYASPRFAAVPRVERPIAAARDPLLWFPVLTPEKEALLERARSRRVEVVPWPWKRAIYPLERDADLRALGLEPGACPTAERVASELVGLPTHRRTDGTARDRLLALLLEVHAP